MTPDEEMALIDIIRTTHPAKFNELVATYHGGLLRFLRGMMRNEHDAEELTQEAFLAAYRNLEQFEGRSSFATWLRRIAYNLAVDRQRKQRVSRTYLAQTRPAEHSTDSNDNPARLAIEHETRECVWAGLQRLSIEQRNILLMREMQGLDYAEIAEVLNVPVGTVRSRLHRARCELKEILLAIDPTLVPMEAIASQSSSRSNSQTESEPTS